MRARILTMAILLALVCSVSHAQDKAAEFANWGDKYEVGPRLDWNTVSTAYDSTGVLWGIIESKRYTTTKRLVRWQAYGWHEVHVYTDSAILEANHSKKTKTGYVPPENAHRLVRGPDGSVVALCDNLSCLPLQLRGDQYRWMVPALFPGTASAWQVVKDSTGESWLVCGTAYQFLIDNPEQQEPVNAFTFIPSDDWKSSAWATIQGEGITAEPLVEDARGRLWLTLRNFADRVKRRNIDSPLYFETADERSVLPHYGPSVHVGLQWIACDSPDRFLLGFSGTAGVVTLNTTSDHLTYDPPGGGDALPSVEVIYSAHGKTFIEGSPISGSTDKELWALEDDGQWTKVISSLDRDPAHFAFSLNGYRPTLETERGFWLGGNGGSSAWFLGKDGEAPVELDWEKGFPFKNTVVIQKLPDGRLLFAGPDHDDLIITEEGLLSNTAPEASQQDSQARVSFESIGHDVVTLDPQGYVWRMSSKKFGVERRANGEWTSFTPHTMPTALNHLIDPPSFFLEIDSTGKVWLFRTLADYAATTVNATTSTEPIPQYCAVFDPPEVGTDDEGQWTVYSSFPEALSTNWPVKFMRRGLGAPSPTIKSLGDRFAFRESGFLYFFNGVWQVWKEGDIGKYYDQMGTKWYRFEKNGQLAFGDYGNRFVLENDSNWTRVIPVDPPKKAKNERPTELVGRDLWSWERDNLGLFWAAYGIDLSRVGAGRDLPALPSGGSAPIGPSDTIDGVMVTREGEYFFLINPNRTYARDVLMLTYDGFPETAAHLEVTREDDLVLNFDTEYHRPLLHTWRWDGGPWADAVDTPNVTLGDVTLSNERLEVMAITDYFVTDPTPLGLKRPPRAIEDQPVETLIANLSDKDFKLRQTAAEALAKRGEAVRQALLAAREQADTDTQWWIDAVLQRISDDSE